MLQLDRENRRLKRIQTEIAADIFVIIFRIHSVIAENLEFLHTFRRICRHHSAVAETAEVLAREEGEAAVVSE